ncbi:hypothetical protein ACF0H5_015864 [Mactra antiquata]
MLGKKVSFTHLRNADMNSMKIALNTLHSIYTCNIHKLPTYVIDHVVNANKSGPAWYNFGKCLNSNNTGSADKSKCLEELEQACSNSDVRVTKVLRLGFTKIGSLLQRLPYLHCLFLLRDPRAILNSRIQTKWFQVQENEPAILKSNVDSLCHKMLGDYNAYNMLQSKFKERLQQVWIHNVTKDEDSMKNLLYFHRLNYTLHKKDREFLDEVFKRKKNNKLFRDWQETLKPEYIAYTEKKCLQFYKATMPNVILGQTT